MTNLTISNFWSFPILRFLTDGSLPTDLKEAKRIKQEATKYTIIAGQLYKRKLFQPLLKCIEPDDTGYILREIHEGYYSHHVGGRTVAQRSSTQGTSGPPSSEIFSNWSKAAGNPKSMPTFTKQPFTSSA
nr:uncharacterized protein LOC112803987 [Arachis hypogaea]